MQYIDVTPLNLSTMKDLLIDFALPILTACIAWFANAYRSKQKKEKDILDNVQQIIDMQKEYITGLEDTLKRNRNLVSKIEAKFERKCASVRKAYGCKVPSEECPVLISDARLNSIESECEKCEHRIEGEK